MDALPLLRSCRDDVARPDEARLRAVRSRLEQRMAGVPAAARPAHPRRVVVGGLGGVAAAGLVAVLVTTGPAPLASAEAARVLDAAAESARSQSVPGSSRIVVVREEGLSEQIDDAGRTVAAYNSRSVLRTRVPAGDGDWIRTSYTLQPDAFYGGDAARALAAREGALDPAYTAARPRVERSSDGTFTNGELGGGSVFGDDPAVLRALPRDATRLLAALRTADLGVGRRGQAAHVLEAASRVLNSGVADGDLQAAVFGALRLQPGLAVVARSVRVDGRDGVAIGEAEPSWKYDADQLLIDPDTGGYLGDRDIALVDQGVIPAGAVLASTSVLRP